MSVVMLRRAIKDLRWTVLWYALGVIIYSLAIMSVYPTIRKNSAAFQDVFKTYPEAFLKAFGVSSNMFEMAAFISAEFLNVIWPLIVAIFVIMAGTSAVAQEVERGTVELWLSIPVSRVRLLSAKIASLGIGIVVIALVTVVSIEVGALLVGEDFGVSRLLMLFPVLVGFPVAVAGYSLLFSSFASERGKVAGLAAVVTLGFYLMWVFAALVDSLSWLRYLTIFTAYKPQPALESGSVNWLQVITLLGLGVAGAVGSLVVFQRRDANP